MKLPCYYATLVLHEAGILAYDWQVFDEAGPTGQAPFHLYTMRQAIEEKFILDVLRNYVNYEAYFRLVHGGRR